MQMDFIFREGIENRFERHKKLAKITREWASNNFSMFPEKGFESITLSVINNTKGIDISELNKNLKERGKQIGDGYGDLKGKTFRIAHMGDMTEQDIKELLEDIDEIIS